MTRKRIIAELRRSAMEDADPLHEAAYDAYRRSVDGWRVTTSEIIHSAPEQWRMFYLLAAEAMEGEQ